MGSHWNPWNPIEIHWIPPESMESPSKSKECHCIPRNSLEIPRIQLKSMEFNWNPRDASVVSPRQTHRMGLWCLPDRQTDTSDGSVVSPRQAHRVSLWCLPDRLTHRMSLWCLPDRQTPPTAGIPLKSVEFRWNLRNSDEIHGIQLKFTEISEIFVEFNWNQLASFEIVGIQLKSKEF